MEEKILETIKKENGKITFKNLLRMYNVGSLELNKILLKLKTEGKILQVGNKYRIFPDDLIIGSIVESATGKKYIMYNGDKIPVAPSFFDNVILNDTVAFKINEDYEAEIISIADRAMGKMTCEVKEIDGKKEVIPFHEGIEIKLDDNILGKLYDGDIIVVNISEENTTYLETIGKRTDPMLTDRAIAISCGFDDEYDEELEKEVDKYPTSVSEEEIIGRKDYRNQFSFTIDGINTKDMDDGVYGEMLPDGTIRVYVHIADVSHYIKPGSKLFERAIKLTTSLYMNNSVIHMLHSKISNGICSLNPNCDRLTKTVVMDIDKDGHIVNYDIQRSVINSKKKMTYEDVDEIIMKNNMVPGYEPFEKTLYILYDAAMRLEKHFVEEIGKITFAETKPSVDYNDDGTVKKVGNPENSIARKIIENIMIGANATVADWFINIGIPTIFRIHELINITKINAIIEVLNKNGFHIRQVKDASDPKIIQKILESLKNCKEFELISEMFVSAMSRARYSTKNLGHYALALLAYLHFTSPIRRLADLLVHTMIDMVLDHPEKLTDEYLPKIKEKLEEYAKKASKMERQAKKAEEISERIAILNYLKRTDTIYHEATVVEVGKRIKIRIDGVDTYINSHDLDKVLSFDAKRKRYFDRNTGQHLKIGAKLYVKINNISPINDKYSVTVYGFANDEIKKRILKK